MAGTNGSVFIDGFVYTYQRHGGINRAIEELGRRLPALGLPVAAQLPRGVAVGFRPSPRYDFPRWIPPHWLWHRASHLNFLRSGAAVYLASYYDPPPARRGLAVAFVYDMIPELMRFDRGKDGAHWRRLIREKRRALMACDRMIAISHNTRSDLLALCPELEPERVSVLHLAVGPEYSPGDGPRADDPYLLFVGNRGGYKNFAQLLRAYAESERLRATFRLKVVTPAAWAGDELAVMAPFADRVERLSSTGEAELIALYRGATAFVYPSLYEGFGLPILEAMACGAPVVIAARSCMPEVGGEAAAYFDPDRPGDLLRVLEGACFDEALQQRLRVAGPARAAQFSWDAFAAGVAGLIGTAAPGVRRTGRGRAPAPVRRPAGEFPAHGAP